MSQEIRVHKKTFWETATPEMKKEWEIWAAQYAEEALEFATATQYLDMHLWPEY